MTPGTLLAAFHCQRLPWLILLLFGLAIGHLVIALPHDTLLERTLQNALHIPAFAALASGLWLTLKQPRAWVVLALCLLVSVAGEGAQLFTARDADGADILRDMLGALLAVGGWQLQGRHATRRQRPWLLSMTGIVVLATLAMPLQVYLAYEHRDSLFPAFWDIGSWRQLPLLESNSPLETVTGPPAWPEFAGRPVAALTWSNTAYPGLEFIEVVGDWRGYNTLVVKAFVPDDLPSRLTVGVKHPGIPGTAAYVAQTLAPGPAELRAPLSVLAHDRDGQPVEITGLLVYTNRSHAGRHLLIGAIYLE